MKLILRDLKRCGIYMIVNTVNNHRYIGSSKNIQQRLQSHRSCLRRGNHYNIHLQRSWNIYSEKNFEYCILEFCTEEDRITRELFYVDTLCPEYNISRDIVELPSYSEESRRKHSITRRLKMAEGIIAKTHCTKLYVYDLEGNFIKKFNSEADAIKELHLTESGITKVLSNHQKQTHGYLLFKEYKKICTPYVRTRVAKKFKSIIVSNNSEMYEFDNAAHCAEYFKVHIVSVRSAIMHNRKFLNKYMIKYKSAVS